MATHAKFRHEEIPCELCGKRLRGVNSLNLHLKEIHGDGSTPPKRRKPKAKERTFGKSSVVNPNEFKYVCTYHGDGGNDDLLRHRCEKYFKEGRQLRAHLIRCLYPAFSNVN